MNANMVQMGIPHQQSPQQQQQQQLQQQPLENISKAKTLVVPLRDSLAGSVKTSAITLNQNYQIDNGVQKTIDVQIPRHDKTLEELYSLCDQIELHLKNSSKCLSQVDSSNRFLQIVVVPTKNEVMSSLSDNSLTYPQYLSTLHTQISYTKEIFDTLVAAAQNISPSD